MRLPPSPSLGVREQLAEFDVWITASLGEVRDTERFRDELDKVTEAFNTLSDATNRFGSLADCSPVALAGSLLGLTAGRSTAEAFRLLNGAASLLFLSTGKTDNNVKCQLPLHLRDAAKWTTYPALRSAKKKFVLNPRATLPRVLPSDDYMRLVSRLDGYPDEQAKLLREFCRFVLSDDRYVSQLWTLGHSYAAMAAHGRGRDLLTPLVIFQVRGSVSASGGHSPERILRERFVEWGLREGIDFNTTDVQIDEQEKGSGKRQKTRAYDFVLPYLTPGWHHRIFIQSQFYAGDSGSVSHKNVEQTMTSRQRVRSNNPEAQFVEYVDGAGYFSSVNGDLQTILSMHDTRAFAQVRSTPIRIRRELQAIGFATTLEVEHAISTTGGNEAEVLAILARDGYSNDESRRACEAALASTLIEREWDSLTISPRRRAVSRRYFLLDTIARLGRALDPVQEPTAGFLLVPGYGRFYGAKLTDVARVATTSAPGFAELGKTDVFTADLEWLEQHRFAVSS